MDDINRSSEAHPTADDDLEGDLELNEEDVLQVIDQSDGEDGMDVDDPDESPDEADAIEEEGDVPDSSIAHFTGHGDHSIFCIAAHPVDPGLVVSGGEDDKAHLWRADTGELITTLSGHTDSVTSVGFSFDGELVATGGMDGRVRLWRRVHGKAGFGGAQAEYARWEFLTNLEGPDEVTVRLRTPLRPAENSQWLAWHPKGLVLAAGSNAGAVWLWSLPSGKVMNVLSSHSSACAAGVWAPPDAGKRLLTASAEPDATVCLWDPRTSDGTPEHRWVLSATAASDKRTALAGGINALATNSAGTLGLVGGQADAEEHSTTGGGLRLLNLATGAIVGTLDGADGHAPDASIEALAWTDLTPNVGLWLSAGTDGKVCAWEGQSGRLRWARKHDDAVSSLVLHPGAATFSTAGADRTIRTWDVRTGNELACRRGHRRVIHAITASKDGASIASGGDDGLGRVFRTNEAIVNGNH